MITKFDPTKPHQTRDGRSVQILSMNGPHPVYPIVGFIVNEAQILTWTIDGRFSTGYNSEYDLINIPEPPTLREWKPSEFVMGATYRNKHNAGGDCVYMLGVTAFLCGVRLQDASTSGITPTYGKLRDDYEYSTDRGKTWHPCGVLE